MPNDRKNMRTGLTTDHGFILFSYGNGIEFAIHLFVLRLILNPFHRVSAQFNIKDPEILRVMTKTSSQENETANQCPLQMEDGVTSPVACCLTHQLANPQHM